MKMTTREKTKYPSNRLAPVSRALIGGLLLTAVVFGAWDAANAQQGTAEDQKGVLITVGIVFDGWRHLNVNEYMSAWDSNAVQYLKNGVVRNYAQILANRANTFPTYSRVDATWTADSVEIYGNTAYVVVRYSMTFYKKNGKVITENEKEFYVLEKKPDMMWFITENYDYLPKK
jgi:hypothetical protein